MSSSRIDVGRPTLWAVCGILIAITAVAYFVHRKMPPYELGFHGYVAEAESKGRGEGPFIGNCPVFPADNVWNTPIDKLAKDAKTEAYIDSIGPLKGMHPDFGSNLNYGVPFSNIPQGTRRVGVRFEYHDDSDLGNYPIPTDAPIEGGASAKGDRHILLIDQRRCILYELFAAEPLPDGTWKAGSGIKMDLTDNALREDGKTSADAAGLPILPGLVRYDEVVSGEIKHALRFTVPETQAAYIWPARHLASKIKDTNYPPMGARFRLRESFDLAKFPKNDQTILTALKRYGMFVADNGGAMFLSGVSDKRWSDDELHKLSAVKAEDFELVDESGWQILANSGRVDPLAVGR